MEDLTVRLAVDAYKLREGLRQADADIRRWGDRLGDVGKGIQERLLGGSLVGFGKRLPIAAAAGLAGAVALESKGIEALAQRSAVARAELDRAKAASTALFAALGEAALPVLDRIAGAIGVARRAYEAWSDLITSGAAAELRSALVADEQARKRGDEIKKITELVRSERKERVALIEDPHERAVAAFNAEFKAAQDLGRKYAAMGLGDEAAGLVGEMKRNAAMRLAPEMSAQMGRENKARREALDAERAISAAYAQRMRDMGLEGGRSSIEVLQARGYELAARQATTVLDYERRIAEVLADQTVEYEARARLADQLRRDEQAILDAQAFGAAGRTTSRTLPAGVGALASTIYRGGPTDAALDLQRQSVALSREQRDRLTEIAQSVRVPFAYAP